MALPLRRAGQAALELFRKRFSAAWARTDRLFNILPDTETLAQPIAWRHPFIFYIGHLPAFSWNQVCGGILQWQSFNPDFDDLFCRGIDPDVDTGECHWHPEVPDQWPSLAETIAYRDRVRAAILDSTDAVRYCRSDDVLAQGGRVFHLVLEHEYMHQETLLYMMQQMAPGDKIRPPSARENSSRTGAECRAVKVPAGRARLGANFADIAFGWDNEFSEVSVEVPSFTMDSLPVTNGQFLQFVASGGYDDERNWCAEDRRWKELENKRYPSCWHYQDGTWRCRALFGDLPLLQVAGWPVYVSLAEARAYAKWCGKRIATEAEFHRAAFYGPNERETSYPWGEAPPSERHGNFDFASWSPAPVGSAPGGASRWGVLELYGNGWELTDTPFAPLPGFEPYMTGYPDYSQDFFNGKHFVLKGASWATDASLLRPSFRNWYQAHYPYVFAKFCCVSD